MHINICQLTLIDFLCLNSVLRHTQVRIINSLSPHTVPIRQGKGFTVTHCTTPNARYVMRFRKAIVVLCVYRVQCAIMSCALMRWCSWIRAGGERKCRIISTHLCTSVVAAAVATRVSYRNICIHVKNGFNRNNLCAPLGEYTYTPNTHTHKRKHSTICM